MLRVENACDDLAAIDAAITAAKADTKRPSLIMCRTVIGIDSAVQVICRGSVVVITFRTQLCVVHCEFFF